MSNFFEENKERFKLYAGAKGRLKAEKLFLVLGKTDGFVNAFNDPVGQEVLQDALHEAEKLLDKIVNEEANEAERAEFRAFKKIIARWQQIWQAHQNALKELQK